jgi:hypothetical protein
MTNSFRNVCLAGLLIGSSVAASAAQIQGVLMDKMCSAKAVKGGQTAATEHDRQCALMPPCQKSGYGVFTSDNRFLTFDEAGNAQALKALQASKKKDDLKVTITGDVQGDTIKVASLKLH